MHDTTQRFSNRVNDYIKYRPDYPAEALNFIIQCCELPDSTAIADVGSGTGIFSKLLLDRGYKVYGVEPNQPMRLAAEELLNDKYKLRFISTDGNAAHTALPSESVNLVTAATAFHWFNPDDAHVEFQRILKAKGWVALLWNVRQPDADEFAQAYEALSKQLPDYNNVNDRYGSYEHLGAFFTGGNMRRATFENRQVFDLAGLKGRAASSSYFPKPDTAAGPIFYEKLEELFNKNQINNQVTFLYNTEIYIGQL